MKKIIGFIDYFPNESGFLIPIFSFEEDGYYLKKYINNEIRKVFLDDEFKNYINQAMNFKKVENKELSIIILKSKIRIRDSKELFFAFKFNKDFIVLGNRENVAKSILFGIGTMDNRLVIYNEIINFISKTDINPESVLRKTLNAYNLDSYYNYYNAKINNENKISDMNKFDSSNIFNEQKAILQGERISYLDLENIAFRNLDEYFLEKRANKIKSKGLFSTEKRRIISFIEIYNKNAKNEKILAKGFKE